MSVNVVDKSTGQTTRVAGNATDSGIGNLSSLTTVDKTSLVSAINEVNGSSVKVFEGTVDDWEQLSTAEKKSYDYAALTNDYDSAAIGNLNSLTTTDKSSIVGAINEINEYTFVGTTTQWNNLTTAQKKAYKYRLLTDDYTDASIGNLSALHTTDKSSVVGAVNEVKDGLIAKIEEIYVGEVTGATLADFILGTLGAINIGNGKLTVVYSIYSQHDYYVLNVIRLYDDIYMFTATSPTKMYHGKAITGLNYVDVYEVTSTQVTN